MSTGKATTFSKGEVLPCILGAVGRKKTDEGPVWSVEENDRRIRCTTGTGGGERKDAYSQGRRLVRDGAELVSFMVDSEARRGGFETRPYKPYCRVSFLNPTWLDGIMRLVSVTAPP